MIITITIDDDEIKRCIVSRWNQEQDALLDTISSICEGDIQMLLGTENCKVNIRG